MADNFLERHMLDYEKKKAKWIARKKHIKLKGHNRIEKPEDEAQEAPRINTSALLLNYSTVKNQLKKDKQTKVLQTVIIKQTN